MIVAWWLLIVAFEDTKSCGVTEEESDLLNEVKQQPPGTDKGTKRSVQLLWFWGCFQNSLTAHTAHRLFHRSIPRSIRSSPSLTAPERLLHRTTAAFRPPPLLLPSPSLSLFHSLSPPLCCIQESKRPPNLSSLLQNGGWGKRTVGTRETRACGVKNERSTRRGERKREIERGERNQSEGEGERKLDNSEEKRKVGSSLLVVPFFLKFRSFCFSNDFFFPLSIPRRNGSELDSSCDKIINVIIGSVESTVHWDMKRMTEKKKKKKWRKRNFVPKSLHVLLPRLSCTCWERMVRWFLYWIK